MSMLVPEPSELRTRVPDGEFSGAPIGIYTAIRASDWVIADPIRIAPTGV